MGTHAFRVVGWRDEAPTTQQQLGAELPTEARLRLRDYYEQAMLPARRLKNSPRTIESDLVCIGRWERCAHSKPKKWVKDEWNKPRAELLQGEPIKDPPIGLVTDEDLTEFVTALGRQLSAKTVQTTVRTLSVIFNHAGPQGPRHRHARDVLLRCPAFPTMSLPIAKKFIPQPATIQALLRASSSLPSRLQPLGRALVLVLASLGIRPRDVCELTKSAFNTAAGELSWVARKTERHKPHPVVCPLPACVANALTELLANPVSRKRLLCSYPMAVKVWRKLLRAAGLTEKRTDSRGRKFPLCSMASLRKYCNTRLNGIRQGAGDWVLGHAIQGQSQVNHEHYSECYVAPDWVRDALLSPQFEACLICS